MGILVILFVVKTCGVGVDILKLAGNIAGAPRF